MKPEGMVPMCFVRNYFRERKHVYMHEYHAMAWISNAPDR